MRAFITQRIKTLIITAIFLLIIESAYSQTSDWTIVNGKGQATRTLNVSGSVANDIYKDIYRWMITRYAHPEEIITTSLENEYLGGESLKTDFVKLGNITTLDLSYHFSFEVKDEQVTITIFNAHVIYDYTDPYGVTPAEDFITAKQRAGKQPEENVLITASLIDFTNAMFNELEKCLVPSSVNSSRANSLR
jgi:hypothetical protein